MTTEERIIELARQAHTAHWSKSKDVSVQTRAAQLVCTMWQALVRQHVGHHLVAEHPLGGTAGKEAIDLIDTDDRIAYELKVSPNNTHFEFYRDVFKVLVFNRRNPAAPLKKLVFITPTKGAARLRSSLAQDVVDIVAGLGVELWIAEIGCPQTEEADLLQAVLDSGR